MSAHPGFQLDSILGTGPDGPVHRGVAERLGARPVAVRHLPLAAGAARARFRQRAEAVARLGHPAVGLVDEIVDVDDDQVLVASTLGDTGSLEDRMLLGPMPVAEAAAIALTLTPGLAAAHRHGLAHGNLSPANVVFAGDRALIADLAIERPGASAAGDRRDLGRLLHDLVDANDPTASAYRRACGWLVDDPAASLDGLAERVATASSVEPAPTTSLAPSPTTHEPPTHESGAEVGAGLVGLVVAGATTLGLIIGGVATWLPALTG